MGHRPTDIRGTPAHPIGSECLEGRFPDTAGGIAARLGADRPGDRARFQYATLRRRSPDNRARADDCGCQFISGLSWRARCGCRPCGAGRTDSEREEGTSMSAPDGRPLSILDLPGIVTLLFARAHRPLLPGAQKPLGLFVRYLRRKPARGLAVIYSVDELGHSGKARVSDPNRSVSLTLDEEALDGAHINFTEAQAREAQLEVQATGVLRAHDIGLSVQAFPADGGLPALATSCDTASHGPVFEALQVAARTQLDDDGWRLISASAIPVRYKPANRCVIRYSLTMEHDAGETTIHKDMTLFGKVYADPEQAGSVQALQQRLYDEQARETEGVPFLPRPLGMIDALGLTFNEAVQPAHAEERLVTGTRALRPQMERGRGGEITELIVPVEELQLTAAVLARLHTSAVRPDASAPRTGAKEAKRARERAA